jgi:cytochrome c oxidase assembly factor CtaG
MQPLLHTAAQSWSPPVFLPCALAVAAGFYLRGWAHLRSASSNVIPTWRAATFLLGLFLIWIAIGSPLAALDEQSLTIHMIQHLLLLSIAPPLILLGASVMPLLHGLPRRFVQSVIGPIFRWPPIQRFGQFLSQPLFCWLAATAALIAWHIPAAFTLALQSEAWHVTEHASFLTAGFLFWWPVIQPWPSVAKWPRWSMPLYLFCATLPCDILSGFLAFCDRVIYTSYLSDPHLSQRPFNLSPLADQECAAALMWASVTVILLVPAVAITAQILSPQRSNSPVAQTWQGFPSIETSPLAGSKPDVI